MVSKKNNGSQCGKIFIISGPSGVGKDTVVSCVKNKRGSSKLRLKEPKAYTTRRVRKSDDMKTTHYVFVTEKQFSELMFTDMVEHAENHGHLYGMSKSSFEECLSSGNNIIKIMDRNGALSFKQLYPKETVLIYLRPPSIEALYERLQGRGSETYAEYNRRMIDNIEELKDMSGFDYVVTADTPQQTCSIIFAILSELVKN